MQKQKDINKQIYNCGMERQNTPEDVRAESRREAGGVGCLWGGGGEDSRKEELIWEGEWKSGHLDKKKRKEKRIWEGEMRMNPTNLLPLLYFYFPHIPPRQ